MDFVKADNLKMSFLQFGEKTVIRIDGDLELVVMEREIDKARFLEVMNYEYSRPEKPVRKQEFKVAGVTYGSRQEALRRLTSYDPKDVHTYLVPESDNEYDFNAIAVHVLVKNSNNTYRIGYIPKEETAIAKNYIGKIPELKVLDGDIKGARVLFAELPVENAVFKTETAALQLVKPERKPAMTRAEKEKAYWTAKGWIYNEKKHIWKKACNW